MRTLDDTLAAARADMLLRGCGIPNREWPFSEGNYCCASVTHWMDDFGGFAPFALENISIMHLRESRRWKEGTRPKPGALVLMNFAGGTSAEHIGLYRGMNGKNVLTYEGNTGPRPGVLVPNGFYERERAPVYVVGYIYPPYATKPAPVQEDSMGPVVSRSFAHDQKLTPGAWKTLLLDRPGSFTFDSTPGPIACTASVALGGMKAGDVAQIRFVKVTVSKLGKETKTVGGNIVEVSATSGSTFGQVTDLFQVDAGERMRVQVVAPEGVTLQSGNVKWHS